MKKSILIASSLILAAICYNSTSDGSKLLLSDIEAHSSNDFILFFEELFEEEDEGSEGCVEYECTFNIQFSYGISSIGGVIKGREENCEPTYKPGDCGVYCMICTAYPIIGGDKWQ